MTKRLRMDLQEALGIGDAFGEGIIVNKTPDEEEEVFGEVDGSLIALRAATQCGMLHNILRDVHTKTSGFTTTLGSSSTTTSSTSATSFTDVLVRDLAVNPYAPAALSYVELGLWQKVLRSSRTAVRDAKIEMARSTESSDMATPESFRELYMGSLTQFFGDELQGLRHAYFDGGDLEMLIRSLESGVDVFSAAEKELLMTRASSVAEEK